MKHLLFLQFNLEQLLNELPLPLDEVQLLCMYVFMYMCCYVVWYRYIVLQFDLS